MAVPGFLRERFSLILLLVLAGFLIIQLVRPAADEEKQLRAYQMLDAASIHLFHHPQCPHCRDAIAFLKDLQQQLPALEITYYNIEEAEANGRLLAYASKHGIPEYELGTPVIIIGERIMVGYEDDATSGATLEQWIRQWLANAKQLAGAEAGAAEESKRTVDLPLFGEIDIFATSLPLLTVMLGLVDGFNPCAMWVLVYLLSIVAGLRDRTRMFLLIGTFLLASGVLYFLFMTAWLNVFLLIGYVRPLTILIGLLAVFMGVQNIRSYIRSGGQVACPVDDITDRQKTMTRIRELVTAPLTLTSLLGMVALAFAVNAIEFVCSSALPAIFTHVLTVLALPSWQYYAYILLYVFVFMLDDLIIFTAAALALERFAGEKYAGYCHLVGGGILVLLGTVLAVYPEILQ